MNPAVFVGLFLLVLDCDAQEHEIRYLLKEGNAIHKYVGNVANDSDVLANISSTDRAVLSFSFLTPVRTHTSSFTLDVKTADLWTTAVLDREELCPYKIDCVLSLVVAVQVNDFLYDVVSVYVSIEDVNDNPPKFVRKRLSFELSESSIIGTLLPISAAIDHDIGKYSVQYYEIVPSDGPFGLNVVRNMDNGFGINLVLEDSLDRETVAFHQLTILAIDGGDPPMTGSIAVNITVTDFNDNPPVFSNSVYNISVKENITFNIPIFHLLATDKDVGLNGQIEYRFSSRVSRALRDTFSIGKTTGAISVLKEINYELGNQIVLVVEAYDQGSPSLSTQSRVLVTILDTTNNPPQIQISFLSADGVTSVEVYERSPKGSFVAHLEIIDSDKGDNGFVTCVCLNTNFTLKEMYTNQYVVLVDRPLDREETTAQTISISCSDAGNPPQRNSATFLVSIKDVNDNAPAFTQTVYKTNMTENNPIGAEVIQVHAVDKDSEENGAVKFLLEPNVTSYFHIDENTGLLTAKYSVDRETNASIQLTVMAKDGGKVPKFSTALVIITVIDVNDEAPRFTQEVFPFKVKENLVEFDTAIGRIVAIDSDAGMNGEITYALLPNQRGISDLFMLSSDGALKTITGLDRETQNRYDITAIAFDKGTPAQSSTVKIVVTVLDENDNSPILLLPEAFNKSFEILYNVPSGTQISSIQGYDLDEGENARLSFSIVNATQDSLISINKDTGTVYTGRDYVASDIGTYDLEISATDNGKPRLTSVITVTITIAYTNDTTYLSTPNKKGGLNQNIVIVISLAMVTASLSIGIVVTICIIKKMDRKKPIYRAKSDIEDIVAVGAQDSSQQDAMLARHLRLSKPKKEVSFSLDIEEDQQVDKNRNVTITSDQTETGAYVLSTDIPLQLQRSFDTESSTDPITLDEDIPAITKEQQDLNRLTSYRLQKVLLQAHDKSWASHEQQYKKSYDALKKLEDNHSESSGETTTSDSGHGGSEEDINNRQRQYMCSDTAAFRSNDDLLHPSSTNLSRPCSADKMVKFVDPTSHCLHQSQGEKYDNSHRTNNTSRTNSTTWLNNPRVKSTSDNDSVFRCNELYQLRNDKHMVALNLSKRTLGDGGRRVNGATRDFRYSLADVDDTVSECATDMQDGDTTTTSGSYTINPDELCNEINDMFFNDLIV